MRNRTAVKGRTAQQSNGVSYDSKHGNKKMPNLTIAIWAAISIAVVFLFASAVSDESYNAQRTLRPKAGKSGKSKKHKSKTLSSNHKKGFGTGKKTTPCPEEFKKTFWIETKKINQPVSRALREQGWRKTDNYEEAQVIWTYASTSSWYEGLKPWQRYNHIPGYKLWNQKDTFVTYMLDYSLKSGKELPAVPETYRLDNDIELSKFKKRLYEEGGIDIPWVLKKPNVNQGKNYVLGVVNTLIKNTNRLT
jgi:hypothetical protein